MDKQDKKNNGRNSEPKEVMVSTTSEVSKGVYSNVALIRHTENEFIIDFLLQFDGSAQMVSRVILSPNHIKALRKALEENLRIFDEKSSKSKQ
jgi:hypothetical protein